MRCCETPPAIREALGMTSAVLAVRLKITGSGVRKLEQAEAADAITLGTLHRAAEALDCELHYTLMPKRPLHEMRRQQALQLAQQWQQRAGRTMALETPGAAVSPTTRGSGGSPGAR